MEQNKDTFLNYYGSQTERQDPQHQYSRMSAMHFPYYPQPQYAVPPFYGSQLQGAQEIHSSSVRPHSDLPGSQLQENSHSSSSSTGPKKKNRWTNTEEKISGPCGVLRLS
ncbi:hypothetical protein ABFA07_012201 [Porites harrisoni]